ncbi:MAG: hypothetical protein M5U16_12365 [Hyphomicrobium sp.]|nr:hypothetical protein [Hyphomicrobium sp.]
MRQAERQLARAPRFHTRDRGVDLGVALAGELDLLDEAADAIGGEVADAVVGGGGGKGDRR